MAIAERFERKLAIVVVGTTLALLYCVAAASKDPSSGPKGAGNSNGPKGAGSNVFDVTSYGAKAGGNKDNVQVSSNLDDDMIY